jgi:hypothetical protein
MEKRRPFDVTVTFRVSGEMVREREATLKEDQVVWVIQFLKGAWIT